MTIAKRTLFFDTETTGLPGAGKPAPRIVQLGAVMEVHGEVALEVNLLAQPDGWVIDPGAAAVHGKTEVMCAQLGVPSKSLAILLWRLFAMADEIVAHNAKFDLMIADNEFTAHGLPEPAFKPVFCTMRRSTDLCKLPGKWGSSYKWPSLQEAHQHFFGEGFDGAHDAMADVRACRRIYHALQDGEQGHVHRA